MAAQEVAWQRTAEEEAEFKAHAAAGRGGRGEDAPTAPREVAKTAKDFQAAAMRRTALVNQAYDGEGALWIVVGGEDKGGIMVRKGESLGSDLLPLKLATGATVMEIEVEGNRLHYKRICGDGPDWGWVNLRHNGKDLLEPDDDPPAFAGTPFRKPG